MYCDFALEKCLCKSVLSNGNSGLYSGALQKSSSYRVQKMCFLEWEERNH